nr:5795_t:CDS:2 [Entrophospora candida]
MNISMIFCLQLILGAWIQIVPHHKYKVAGLNSLWHIDGHHELIRWKLVVHGEAIKEWGCPSRIRGDHEIENCKVAEWILTNKRLNIADRNSFTQSWNFHSIRTEKHLTPRQLFLKGMVECGFHGIEVMDIDNEYSIDWEGPTPEHLNLSVDCILNDVQYLSLKNL